MQQVPGVDGCGQTSRLSILPARLTVPTKAKGYQDFWVSNRPPHKQKWQKTLKFQLNLSFAHLVKHTAADSWVWVQLGPGDFRELLEGLNAELACPRARALTGRPLSFRLTPVFCALASLVKKPWLNGQNAGLKKGGLSSNPNQEKGRFGVCGRFGVLEIAKRKEGALFSLAWFV